MTSNVLPLHVAPSQASSSQNSNVEETLEGYKIKSALRYKIFSTLAKNSNLLQSCSFHIGSEIVVLCPFHAPQKNVGPKIFVAKILCYMFHRQTFWKCDCECVQKTFWHLILQHYICNIYTHSL